MAGMAFGTQAIDLLSAQKKQISTPLPEHFTKSTIAPKAVVNSPLSRATESLEYTLAGKAGNIFSLGSSVTAGSQVAQALEFTTSATKRFAGNNVTSISFYTPFTGTNQYINTIDKATVFFTDDLDKDPFYTQEVTLPTGIDQGFISFTVNLTTPQAITDGKPFFAGFYFTLDKSTKYYIVTDYSYPQTNDGCYLGYRATTTGNWEWDDFSTKIGSLCISLGISGDKMPVNEVEAAAMATPPIFTTGNGNMYQLLIYNNAANKVSSVEITTKVGDLAPVAQTVSLGDNSLSYNQGAVLTIQNVTYDKEGYNIPVIVTVTKVNGETNNASNPSAGTYVNCLAAGNGYSRNIVIEESTGTWCGYCPFGYSTMEALKEKYTDGTVILSAVHDDDYMPAASYEQWFQLVDGFPMGIVNRIGEADITDLESTEEYISYFKSYPTISKVSLSAENKDNTTLSLSADVEFSLPVAANDFALAFALTEDGVGPYDQTNYMSGDANYRDSEWYSKPNPVSLVYNDVARDIKDVWGIQNSLPNALEAKKATSYSTTMSLATIANAAKTCKAMVYVINQTTGAIENAAVVDVHQGAGVDDAVISESAVSVTTVNGGITVEGNEGLVEVYTVEGRKVAQTRASGTINLAKGIYIVKADDTVAKVLVK